MTAHTMTRTKPAHPPALAERLATLMRNRARVLLGLTGCPGAGKSTLAANLQRAFGSTCQVVPMDGFHLANVELARLGRAARKGAPDTFDGAGYVALIERLRRQRADEVVYAPEFRREIEEPIAGAIAILPETRLVITEGNYLLQEGDPWAALPTVLDEIWFVDVDPQRRQQWLADRHQRFGRSREEALAWIANTDEPNARLIEATRARADFVVDWGGN